MHVQVSSNTQLSRLDLPKLTRVGKSLTLVANTLLNTASIPALETVGADFHLGGTSPTAPQTFQLYSDLTALTSARAWGFEPWGFEPSRSDHASTTPQSRRNHTAITQQPCGNHAAAHVATMW